MAPRLMFVREEKATRKELDAQNPGLVRIRITHVPLDDALIIGTTAMERRPWVDRMPVSLRAIIKPENKTPVKLLLDYAYMNSHLAKLSPDMPIYYLLKAIGSVVAKEWTQVAEMLKLANDLVAADSLSTYGPRINMKETIYPSLANDSTTIRAVSAILVLTRNDFARLPLDLVPPALLTDNEKKRIAPESERVDLREFMENNTPGGDYGVGEGNRSTRGWHDRKGGR